MTINLETLASVFPFIFVGLLVLNLVFLYVAGRRAERVFIGVTDDKIIFRERGASGFSKKSFLTRVGGASKVLDIIVTDSDILIKGIYSPFSFIGTFYDLTHRIDRKDITSLILESGKAHLSFNSDKGTHNLVLLLKETNSFIEALSNERNA